MKTILLSLLISMSAIASTSTGSGGVYICTGPKATVYHSRSNCRGLNRCSGEIKKVSLQTAQNEGRRPCKICY